MAQASVGDIFPCSCEEFFRIVTDYSNYPEFLQEVKKCEVLKEEAHRKLVEYQVSLMKDFRYQLWMKESSDSKSVSWEFASGDIFKSMKGSWVLQDEGGKCRATYSIDAEFGLFVPGPLAKALVSVNLPNMISSYHRRVKELYGRS